MKKDLSSVRKQIVEIGRRSYEKSYIASNDGNISARIGKTKIVITPAGVNKGFMEPSDLVLVDIRGKLIGNGEPSSEIYMHLKIYEERPDIVCVCHLHPLYSTGFAVAGIPIEDNILSETVISLGRIILVDYGTPGTEELFSRLKPHLHLSDAFLLANHGALTLGKSVFDAYNKMETLEHTARINFIAKQIGKINKLSKEEVGKLTARRGKF